jgi:hypothetical protein
MLPAEGWRDNPDRSYTAGYAQKRVLEGNFSLAMGF